MFKKINLSSQDFENKFWKAKSAESFDNNLPVKSNDPAVLIFRSAMNELRKTRSKSSAVQLARVERVLEINTDNQIKIIEKNKYIDDSIRFFENEIEDGCPGQEGLSDVSDSNFEKKQKLISGTL